ncbi:pirin family protein [Enterovibrio sp. ZSDZ35]|uniref:Pirin family protein n=1 Tax=Enterovibrio qingdaonensis TaxID=2899818 RepID=A0ABT5QK73_9GAMM|nr:pirin family protein [Enterovibrio sp. ZSDZ35]MDD1781391.1 pirin family protein [Enterovibrio sp. ZSDZ35]
MKILERDSLPRGGFAGIEETRLVVDKKLGGNGNTWDGLGQFVYLADARYLPFGESKMHSHREVDVITVMLEGDLQHEGSMKHGRSLKANEVQVQRAGGEGFSHNEINPAEFRCRLLQVWALPETAGERADYKSYEIALGELTQIYGDDPSGKADTFSSSTRIYVGLLTKGQTVSLPENYMLYAVNGRALIDDNLVKDGTLVSGNGGFLVVDSDDVHLTLIEA